MIRTEFKHAKREVMEDTNKTQYKENFLNAPSIPEVIRVDKIRKHKHSIGDARLRLGFISQDDEISFDVSKILTKEMLIDLHKMIGKIINQINEEEEEIDAKKETSDENL